MTECERIIQSGLIREDFLKEENRDDFYISKERKKTWAVNLDLLDNFKRVCEKHHLKWYLMFGSLLGAIRHHGFIPWDDDIDVVMPRDDYEKLQALPDAFTFPYFLQTPYSEKDYFYSYIKIRNSNTTCISRAFGNCEFNQGMMLDIFCIDKWDIENGKDIFETIGKLIIDNSNYMRRNMSNPTDEDLERIKKYSGNDPMENYLQMEKLARTFENSNSNYLCLPLIQAYGYQKDVFFAEDFAKETMVKFENDYEFPVPCGYERILSTIYGNWREFPPVDKRGIWHDSVVDTDVPYLLMRENG